MGCAARGARGWGCGVVASRSGLVPEAAGEGNWKNARRRIRRAAGRGGGGWRGDADGDSGRETWATTTEKRRAGRSRAPVEGRRRARRVVRAGGARRRGRVPLGRALTGVERTSTGRRPVVSFRRARLAVERARLIAALETATLAGRDLESVTQDSLAALFRSPGGRAVPRAGRGFIRGVEATARALSPAAARDREGTTPAQQ